MPSPPDPVDDLRAALERLRISKPAGWLDIIADAVVDLGGTDAAELLHLAVDRAASGHPADDGDPEAALEALEADLRAVDAQPKPSVEPTSVDVLANLLPLDDKRSPDVRRDMGH